MKNFGLGLLCVTADMFTSIYWAKLILTFWVLESEGRKEGRSGPPLIACARALKIIVTK